MNMQSRLSSLVLLLACSTPLAAQTLPAREQQREIKETQAKPVGPAKQTQQANQTAGKTQNEVTEAIDAIRTYSIERRKDAMDRARQAAEELDHGAAELQDQLDRSWDRMSQTTRARSSATMADLRQRRRDLAEWYGGMQHGSAEAWTEVKDGFVRSYHDLAEAMQKARSEFEREATAPEEKKSSEKQQELER